MESHGAARACVGLHGAAWGRMSLTVFCRGVHLLMGHGGQGGSTAQVTPPGKMGSWGEVRGSLHNTGAQLNNEPPDVWVTGRLRLLTYKTLSYM